MPYAFRLRFHVADRSQLNIDSEEWQIPIEGVDVRLCQRLANRKYGGVTAREFLMTAYSYRRRIVHGGDIPAEDEIRNMLGDLERFASDLLTLSLVGEE